MDAAYLNTKRQICSFRIKELQECLERLGMRKQGNKPELQSRLLAVFADSPAIGGYVQRDKERLEVAKRVIDSVFARMSGTPSTMAQSGVSGSSYSHAEVKPQLAAAGGTINSPSGQQRYNSVSEIMEAALQRQRNSQGAGTSGTNGTTPSGVLRCHCGSRDASDLVSCSACGMRQHRRCNLVSGADSASSFMCETCRAQRADPFWEVVTSDVMPTVRLYAIQRQGSMPSLYGLERSFLLPLQHAELLKAKPADYQLQVHCMQLHDTVPNRFHWPLACQLHINGIAYRVYGRNSTTKLGANARDEPANISSLVSATSKNQNRLQLSSSDPLPYVVMVALVRRRTMEGVRALMKAPLGVLDAIERVRKQGEHDDDDDLVTDKTVLSLKCPLTGMRMKRPARFAQVPGLACFDLEPFLDLAQRTRKWQCPHSMTHTSVQTLQVDTFMERVLTALETLPDVGEVEVGPDARWRPSTGASTSSVRWISVAEDPHVVSIALQGAGASRHQNGAAGNENGSMANGAGGANGHGNDGDDSDEEDEEDELEELRRAAAAMRKQADANESQKRKRAPLPDIIVIDSSDDEEPPLRPASSSRQGPAAGTSAAAGLAAAGGSASGAAGAGSSVAAAQQQPGGSAPPIWPGLVAQQRQHFEQQQQLQQRQAAGAQQQQQQPAVALLAPQGVNTASGSAYARPAAQPQQQQQHAASSAVPSLVLNAGQGASIQLLPYGFSAQGPVYTLTQQQQQLHQPLQQQQQQQPQQQQQQQQPRVVFLHQPAQQQQQAGQHAVQQVQLPMAAPTQNAHAAPLQPPLRLSLQGSDTSTAAGATTAAGSGAGLQGRFSSGAVPTTAAVLQAGYNVPPSGQGSGAAAAAKAAAAADVVELIDSD